MRYFIDMDGTLAVYPIEEPGWWNDAEVFANMEPQEKVIEAIRTLIEAGEDVYILSAYNKGAEDVKDAKDAWLDKYLPEIDYDNRIYTLCGEEKTDYVPGGLSISDVLLDDYNKNLIDWSNKGGVGIKLLNGINNPHSWDGISVHAQGSIDDILQVLEEVKDTLELEERNMRSHRKAKKQHQER